MMSEHSISIPIPSLDNTQYVASHLAEQLPTTGLINFNGQMGSGKTTFIRFLITHLFKQHDVRIPDITSPTYGLVHEYRCGPMMIAHFDLYRLKHSDEMLNLGIDEYLDQALCLIEWPENGGIYTHNPLLQCDFFIDSVSRHLTLTSSSAYKLDTRKFKV